MYLFIGEDESYDKGDTENCIFAFVVINNEDEYKKLKSDLEKYLHQNNISEYKNHKNSERVRSDFIRLLKNVDFSIYYDLVNNFNEKNILTQHSSSTLKFVDFVAQGRHKNTKPIRVDLKIDRLGGSQYQEKLIRKIQGIFRSNKIKSSVRFLDSKDHTILQVADLFAGEIRRALKGKSAVQNILSKSKILQ